MLAADAVDRQRRDMIDVAMHHPFEPVADADDVHAVELRADGRRADHAVDAGRRPSADQDREMLLTVHFSPDTRVGYLPADSRPPSSNEPRFVRKPRVLIAPYSTPAPSHTPPAIFAGQRRLSQRYRQIRNPSSGSTKSCDRRCSVRTQ